MSLSCLRSASKITAHKCIPDLLDKNSNDSINVRQLFLRQIRSFPKMPKNAGDLLGVYGSEPVKLER